jgi:glycine/serine hydroxymethyltransferase
VIRVFIEKQDKEINAAINDELQRQKDCLMMIPSENLASKAVLEALGSVLSNKYSEGYPGKRLLRGLRSFLELSTLMCNAILEALLILRFTPACSTSGTRSWL